jgi:flagellar biosynthesis protein FliR
VTNLFDFNQEEMLTFFAVLVRFSVIFALLPIVGDRFVPLPVKVLLSLAVSVALFPAMIASGEVRPNDAMRWGASASSLAGVMAFETVFALIIGFVSRLAFDAVSFGGNLAGSFMGFAMASTYDPHQESQTQVIAEIQMAIAILTFLALDGHHLMLRAALESYKLIGVGGLGTAAGAGFGPMMSERLVDLSGQVIKLGVQLGAPVALALFGVNIVFGIVAKAMPQMNILVLSFATSALIGLCVLFVSVPEYVQVVGGVTAKVGEWMRGAMLAIAAGR